MNQLPNDASSDQSNCPDGYYRNSKGMVMQIPPPDADKIDAVLDIDINDQEALKELATITLVQIIKNSPKNVSLVAACKEILDRAVGKAPQSIAMTVKADPVSKLTDDQLAAILANLPGAPMIIPPMPKKLDID